MEFTPIKYWHPYISPFDPCPPMRVKCYSTPPHLYICYQPYGWPQFSPREALYAGTLWPALYDPYKGPCNQLGVRNNES
ncbi:spore coat associated protein CotJA [Anaerobacillus sp. MEB173]|uniref:spore coat associated protein CotJA n=1 Tax=Anaerobacillus sp. MEB173 TaxID=3383345 RepID=UPI003F8DEFA1